MYSIGIIIFREVFEIVLILGIVLAATHNIPGRTRWIVLGLVAGLIGSAMIAVFIDSISEFAEGMGQEIFNACILFTAALFIGWTVLWMKRHAREMKQHFNALGNAVADGSIPFYSLSAVIALAMLREGSEIVLFTYGMLASGESVTNLMIGAAGGTVAGLVVGVLMYAGLIRIPMKYFFRITGGLLLLLVAGMMSQGVGFLISAGYFESLSHTAWDSSALLSDNGMLGQSLQTLLGYTARPAVIQVIVYAMTLGLLLLLMRQTGKPAMVRQTQVPA